MSDKFAPPEKTTATDWRHSQTLVDWSGEQQHLQFRPGAGRSFDPEQTDAVDIVWGVGGERGPALLGGLRWLEERKIRTGTETGVSAGSIVAAFHTNGYSADQIAKIFVKEFNKSDGLAIVNAVNGDDDFGTWMAGGSTDSSEFFKRLVKTYKLEPNERLQIVAYDALGGNPVVFRGRDYDLAGALRASTALPGHLAASWDWSQGWPRMMVDGGVYKLNPFEFSRPGAIAFRVEQDNDQIRRSTRDSWVGGFIDSMLGRWQEPVPLGSHVVNLRLDHSPVPRLSDLQVRRLMREGHRQASKQLLDYKQSSCFLQPERPGSY